MYVGTYQASWIHVRMDDMYKITVSISYRQHNDPEDLKKFNLEQGSE